MPVNWLDDENVRIVTNMASDVITDGLASAVWNTHALEQFVRALANAHPCCQCTCDGASWQAVARILVKTMDAERNVGEMTQNETPSESEFSARR